MDEEKMAAKHEPGTGHPSLSRTLTLSPRRLRRNDVKSDVDVDFDQSQASELGAETKRELERRRKHDQRRLRFAERRRTYDQRLSFAERRRTYEQRRLRFAERVCDTMALKLSTGGNIALLVLLVGGLMTLEYVVLPHFHIIVQAISQTISWIPWITFVATYSILMLFFMAEILTGESPPTSRFDTKTSDRQQFLSLVPTGLDGSHTHSASANVVAPHEISHRAYVSTVCAALTLNS